MIKNLKSLCSSLTKCIFHGIDDNTEILQTAFTWSNSQGALVLAMSKKYILEANENTAVIAVICPKKLAKYSTKPYIASEEAESLFFHIHNHCFPTDKLPHEVSVDATISPHAIIEEGVYIGPFVTIEAGCVISAGTYIEEGSYIGPNCTIGTQGLLPKKVFSQKCHIKHFGGVYIGHNVFIHAGSNVSKALHNGHQTTIGRDTHLGIQTNIAHDVTIGKACNISGQTAIAGRACLADNVWVGTGVAISNWVNIGSNASIKLGTVVIDDVDEGQSVSGNFALPHQQHLLEYVKQKRVLKS